MYEQMKYSNIDILVKLDNEYMYRVFRSISRSIKYKRYHSHQDICDYSKTFHFYFPTNDYKTYVSTINPTMTVSEEYKLH